MWGGDVCVGADVAATKALNTPAPILVHDNTAMTSITPQVLLKATERYQKSARINGLASRIEQSVAARRTSKNLTKFQDIAWKTSNYENT